MASKENTKKALSFSELHDLPSLKLSEVKEQILISLDSNQHRGVPALIGDSGLGKTQIFSQIAKETNRDLRVIHTASWGLVGTGIPSTKYSDDAAKEEVEKFFKMRLPNIFPKSTDRAILLFDEINRGLKHAIHMFFNLLEDRSMFDYHLPNECLVAATMNPSTAGYQVTEIMSEPAIRRRMKFFNLIDDFGGFLRHAKSNNFHQFSSVEFAKNKGCHPDILSFYEARPDSIYDHKARNEGKLYTCPANIETISEDAYYFDGKGYSLYCETARNRYAASIGETATRQLIAHLQDASVTISAKDVVEEYQKVAHKVQILRDKNHEPLGELCGNVLSHMFSTTPPAKLAAKNFLQFCSDVPVELCSSMLFQIRKVATDNKAMNYLDDIMQELQNEDAWIELNKSIDTRHRNIDKNIRF